LIIRRTTTSYPVQDSLEHQTQIIRPPPTCFMISCGNDGGIGGAAEYLCKSRNLTCAEQTIRQTEPTGD
jgi:hypothetical protein